MARIFPKNNLRPNSDVVTVTSNSSEGRNGDEEINQKSNEELAEQEIEQKRREAQSEIEREWKRIEDEKAKLKGEVK